MSEGNSFLQDAAERYFAKACHRSVLEAADRGVWQAVLWAEMESLGYAHPLDPAGFGAIDDLAAEHLVLTAAARHAAPLPIAETMLAGLLLREAGLPVPAGPLTVVVGDLAIDAQGRVFGHARRVAYAVEAGHALAVTVDGLALLTAGSGQCLPGRNLANEPRDQLILTGARPLQWQRRTVNLDAVRERAALMRAAQLAAACEQALHLAISHAQQRKQFGKTIASFQAIQHSLAVAAGHAAAAKTAVLAAYGVLERKGAGSESGLAAAMAKSRAGEAAAQVAAITHQVLGAMGFTQEHALHFATRRLQSWRSEWGSERHWQEYLGRRLLAVGADGFWPLITSIR